MYSRILDLSEHSSHDQEEVEEFHTWHTMSMHGEAAAGDPFYKVRDNVNAQVERIKVKHEKFQDLLLTNDTGGMDLRELRKVLLKELKAAEKDVRGLQIAIDMIEKNRCVD